MALSYLWPSSPPPLATAALPSVSPAPSPPHGWANSNVIWPCVNRHDLTSARMATRGDKRKKVPRKSALGHGKVLFRLQMLCNCAICGALGHSKAMGIIGQGEGYERAKKRTEKVLLLPPPFRND
ncbi:hypothetical protein niasHS_007292 [Heterodera schachtii]|uniref:Uncharacterized protein n=1 Tax=Heterodera schachtii TaxID=97005 RepID=A0ABD2JJX3_HETSC